MQNVIDKIEWMFAGLGGFLGWFFGGFDGFLYALVVFVVCDYFTGVLAAAIKHELSSEVGFKGIAKKVCIFVLVGIANIIDTQILQNGAAIRTAVVFFYLANEGLSCLENVLARKTFTPNFLTHKAKKNNNDRTQYRQRDHHEAIVSRDVFNAANHLRASRTYKKKNHPLPVLSVVDDGVLRGYVPFDKDWTGFSAEEYREASESVMREKQSNTVEVRNRLDLTGYEVVRAQYFATLQNPAMTISNGRLRFNAACLKKFDDVEYVELLLNSVDRCIAIRPCEKSNPNAIRWGRLKEGRWCASTLGCRGLAKALFDIMEWDEDLKYRFRGQLVEQGGDKLMLFELDEPEMIKVEEIVLPPKEEESEGETVKKTIYIFPPEWAGTFGQPITSVAQIGILQQEHYAGNWDVLRPASEIKEMNIFTADGLNTLLHEAEEIMEGWIDIDGGKQNVNAAEGAGIGD